MDSFEEKVLSIVKNITSTMGPESVLVASVQELVKDEIKKYIRQKLESKPALKAELKHAIEEYLEAKLKEWYATLKLAKASAKLGLDLVPERLRKELEKELVGIFEKEVSELVKRTI